MAKATQGLSHMTLSAAYTLKCFNVEHPAVSTLLALAYLAIAVKYLCDAVKRGSGR